MTEKDILLQEIKYYEAQLQKESNKRVSEYLINKIADLKQEILLIEMTEEEEEISWDLEKEYRIDLEGFWRDVADAHDIGEEICDISILLEPYYLDAELDEGFEYGNLYKVERVECDEINDYWVIKNSTDNEYYITSEGLMYPLYIRADGSVQIIDVNKPIAKFTLAIVERI